MKLVTLIGLILASAALAGGDASVVVSDATTYWTNQALTSTTVRVSASLVAR